MALDSICLKLLAPHIKGARILCLAYPDIVVAPVKVERILGIKIFEITHNGGAHKRNHPLPETLHVLKQAGAARVRVTDVAQLRGMEEPLDLNDPVEWTEQFDLILNPGTLEHCFNVGQAWRNAWEACATGGRVFHVAPATMMNHGFWSMNPTLYYDFADENGGEVEAMALATLAGEAVNFEPRKRFMLPPNVVLYCMMKKVREVGFTFPTQWKYRR